MTGFVDIFPYIAGDVQIVFGFYILTRLLYKKVELHFYLLFTVCAMTVIWFMPRDTIAAFMLYILLLMAGGVLICHADRKSAVLYVVLVVAMMELAYGIVKSLMSILYPWMSAFDQNVVGMVFMVAGEAVSLLLTGLCCLMVRRYFADWEGIEKQYMFLVFIPILMVFLTDEYISSSLYGMVVTDGGGITIYINHYHMLVIQLLGMVSLYCILFTYKKLLQSFRLTTELSLLEQEERSLNQYVEEAKTRYERTASFRHDIKNHLVVIRELLQNGKPEQALAYIRDMGDMAEELSFPCSTNNPVVDILAGNKLGIAKSMGIDVRCSLLLPYPCGLRDIDLCVILSNALDNAIHACGNMDDDCGEKYICVTGRIQGDFLLMEIENSFRGKGPFKKGTGLSNIKAVTEKYHGAMSVKTQGGVFILNVLLIIPQHVYDAEENGSSTVH